jgi:hypothetical protein
MRWAQFALSGALFLAACGPAAPHPYPADAKARFDASCPPEDKVCACTWDKITRTLSYEEYQAALTRMRERGNMDPRVTRARGACLEQN